MSAVKATASKPLMRWVLYLLECRGGSYYAGITTDLARRFAEHQAGTGGRYTRAHRPIRIVASRQYPDRSSASRAEYVLKQLPRKDKPGYFLLENTLSESATNR